MFRLLAVKEVFGNPQRFGFLLKREHLYPGIPYKEVAVDTEISDLSNFAQKQGITYAQLQRCQPLASRFITKKQNREEIRFTYTHARGYEL